MARTRATVDGSKPPVATIEPIVEAVEDAGLHYTSDADPGITRRRHGDDFVYLKPNGDPVEDEKTLGRIRSLAIPPAYEDVWICKDAKGHLQATGKDARGRKQYRYHPRFREVRDEAKFARMAEFGSALPRIHERLETDLARRGLPREKVLATVVELLEKSLIRVGSEEYVKENKSHGLTTMDNRNVKVEGSEITFTFLGKSKVRHRITLKDRKLANVVRKVQDLPGQHLFSYLDEEGQAHTVTSHDVNEYLKEIAGGEYTAKDFRTWAGTVLALTELAHADAAETKKTAKGIVTNVIKVVARQLGNTPAVCRKCYVHPAVLDAYTTGRLRDYLAGQGEAESAEAIGAVERCAEDAVIALLRAHEAERHLMAEAPAKKSSRRKPGAKKAAIAA